MASQHTKLLLKSLGYPQAQTFSVAYGPAFRDLVFQLEDKWIRALAPGRRGSLAQQDVGSWTAAFQQYLTEVDCPLTYHPGRNEEDALDWLLHLAVSYAYEDSGAAERDAAAPEVHHTSTYSEWISPEVEDAVQKLMRTLQLQTPSSSVAEQLAVIKEVVGGHMLPQAEAARSGKGRAAATPRSLLDTYSQTLGFTTGDAQVDAAATVMRMLFIRDLRQLQTQVDDAIVAVQEFTQNPRANAALGVIGK